MAGIDAASVASGGRAAEWSKPQVWAIFAAAAAGAAALSVAMFLLLLLALDLIDPGRHRWVTILAAVLVLVGGCSKWTVARRWLAKHLQASDPYPFMERVEAHRGESFGQHALFFPWCLCAWILSAVLYFAVSGALEDPSWIGSRNAFVLVLFLPIMAFPFAIALLDPLFDRRAPVAWAALTAGDVMSHDESILMRRSTGVAIALFIALSVILALMAFAVLWG